MERVGFFSYLYLEVQELYSNKIVQAAAGYISAKCNMQDSAIPFDPLEADSLHYSDMIY